MAAPRKQKSSPSPSGGGGTRPRADKADAARAARQRAPAPVPADQSVVGEEDPGSALDETETNQPPRQDRTQE